MSGQTQNYFELMGLSAVFELDQADLAARYHTLQNSVHPDRYANATDQERRLSVQRAAQINEAFSTLKDPLRRAVYLLQLSGIDIHERSSAMEPAFLMEQMERREQLMEIRGTENPLEVVAKLIDSLNRQLRAMTDELTGQFAAGATKEGPDALQRACDNVQKMQFIYKLHEEANELEADLEDELL